MVQLVLAIRGVCLKMKMIVKILAKKHLLLMVNFSCGKGCYKHAAYLPDLLHIIKDCGYGCELHQWEACDKNSLASYVKEYENLIGIFVESAQIIILVND